MHQSRDERIREIRDRIGQRLAHFVGVALHIAGEHRLADDAERESAHLPGDVEFGAGRDVIAPASGMADERVGEPLHVLTMKQRLDGAPLLQVV